MTHYVRTTSSTDAQTCDSEEGAIKQVQVNIARQKSFGREVARDGEKIIFREKTGELFDVMWAEDEDGNPVHVPMV